jgi:hypothetical protein
MKFAGFKDADFDFVIADYLPRSTSPPKANNTPSKAPSSTSLNFLEGLI